MLISCPHMQVARCHSNFEQERRDREKAMDRFEAVRHRLQTHEGLNEQLKAEHLNYREILARWEEREEMSVANKIK